MNYKIEFTTMAKDDLFEIYKYVALNDTILNADKLIKHLKLRCLSLDILPNRGHKLPEIEYREGKDFLEIHYMSYRIIYRIVESVVFIHCILDGRRDLNDLLNKRLLR